MTAVSAPSDPRSAQRRALLRALANGGAATVTRLRYGLYVVESASRPGAAHRVSHPAGRPDLMRCSCEAALAGRVCWHWGAVVIAKTEAGGGRVTGPAAPARPPAPPDPPANVVPLRRAA